VAVRSLVAWCPDWPLVAVGASLQEPTAVVHANRVVAASAAARELGVSRGMRMRAAQGRCPELAVHARDDSGEVRAFEPVLGALGAIAARIEVLRPGTCAIAMRGPLRYFGGDLKPGRKAHDAARQEKLSADDSAEPGAEFRVAELVRCTVGEALDGRSGVRIGVADGVFAAELAARAAAPVRVVAAGETAAFLAPAPIGLLGRPDLADVLVRLGIRTLGDFAALPARDVLARFGTDALDAHRLASGLDERPSAGRRLQPEWSVSTEIDPPADRIDRAAFVSRSMADELHRRLSCEGVSCEQVAIEAETEHGESSVRVWRHGGALSSAALADRVRWQLDGWLNGPPALRPSAGISRVTLVPVELIAAKGRQLGFWGGETEADERAARAAARLQGRLGPAAVKVVERRGGRHPNSQLVLVPAASVELVGRTLAERVDAPPWPGSLPAPSPTRLLDPSEPVEVLDAAGRPVRVSGRGMLSEPPRWLLLSSGAQKHPPDAQRLPDARSMPAAQRSPPGPGAAGPELPSSTTPVGRSVSAGAGFVSEALGVVGWSGPWPVEERWWDAGARRRLVRMQAMTDDGIARLLVLENGCWRVTAEWD